MRIIDEIPQEGIGIAMDPETGEVFIAINGELIPLPEKDLDDLIVALMYMMQVQEMKRTAENN